MKILYIWDADYPWDVRVEKICKSLCASSNEVHIAARNLKKNVEYELNDGIYIHRLKSFKNQKVNYILSFPAFFSPIWKRFLDNIIIEHKIELVIVRDLPMAIAGIWAGKRRNIPVVFDMAEDYIAMIQDIWRAKKFSGLNLLVRNPYLAKYVERYTLKNIDHILVVIEEGIDVVVSRGGKKEKVTVVGNTPLLNSFTKNDFGMNDELELIRKRFSAIYTGGIQMGRGLQVVLEALPVIVKEIPDFLFVIVGDGYATNYLKDLIKTKALQDYVCWVGWVSHENIYNYIKACKIGIIPHLVSNHVNSTIPNKIFDYMGCGLPVVASDAIPMKRILDEEKCGIAFLSGNKDDLASAIHKIYSSRFDYGCNGKIAVQEKYNWEEDEKRLLLALNRI